MTVQLYAAHVKSSAAPPTLPHAKEPIDYSRATLAISYLVTRAYRRTLFWASSRRTSRLRSAAARSPK
jgi:hypothetical protein